MYTMGAHALVRIRDKSSFKFLPADREREIDDVIYAVYMIKNKTFVKVKHFCSLYWFSQKWVSIIVHIDTCYIVKIYIIKVL